MKIGEYEVTIKKGDEELTELPSDLPVHDFEGNVVTLEEARGGYLRQSDYSKKTAEVADMKRLFQDLGVQDPKRGVGIMRHLLGVVAELEEKGIIDPNTGEILEQGQVGEQLTAEQMAANQASLPPAVQKQLKELSSRLGAQERDVGALLSIISKRDIQTAFPTLTEENLVWIDAMVRDNPENSPMEYAKALNDQLEARGQVAIDEHAKQQEELRKQELGRISQKGGIEVFGEDVKFSFDPESDRHKEGEKVLTPREAAIQHMEAALTEEE
jgi:hypothetical protein